MLLLLIFRNFQYRTNTPDSKMIWGPVFPYLKLIHYTILMFEFNLTWKKCVAPKKYCSPHLPDTTTVAIHDLKLFILMHIFVWLYTNNLPLSPSLVSPTPRGWWWGSTNRPTNSGIMHTWRYSCLVTRRFIVISSHFSVSNTIDRFMCLGRTTDVDEINKGSSSSFWAAFWENLDTFHSSISTNKAIINS